MRCATLVPHHACADLSSIIRESLRLYFVLREATHLTELRFEQAPRRSSGIGEFVTISRSALCSGVGLNRSSDACGLPEKRLMTYSARADCNLQARAAPRQSIRTGVSDSSIPRVRTYPWGFWGGYTVAWRGPMRQRIVPATGDAQAGSASGRSAPPPRAAHPRRRPARLCSAQSRGSSLGLLDARAPPPRRTPATTTPPQAPFASSP